jgi:hypothetical protein
MLIRVPYQTLTGDLPPAVRYEAFGNFCGKILDKLYPQ